MSDALTIGVLAVQGDVREHVRVLTELGAHAYGIRRPTELANLDYNPIFGPSGIESRTVVSTQTYADS